MSEELPKSVTIERILKETPTIRTFVLSEEFSYHPGQFVMVWVLDVDEIPMALSSPHSISVQRVGDATSALFSLKPGAKIGIRGPYGNWFPHEGEVLAICGGIGAAPLIHLAKIDCINTFLLGARTEDELPFVDILDECTNLLIATDDGTLGYNGYVTGLLNEPNLVDLKSFDTICVCGPERMMKTVLNHLEKEGMAQKGYFSLNRYMKCGLGICGSCCIDPSGFRVCRDGPIFNGEVLLKSEFGTYSRDACGIKHKIE